MSTPDVIPCPKQDSITFLNMYLGNEWWRGHFCIHHSTLGKRHVELKSYRETRSVASGQSKQHLYNTTFQVPFMKVKRMALEIRMTRGQLPLKCFFIIWLYLVLPYFRMWMRLASFWTRRVAQTSRSNPGPLWPPWPPTRTSRLTRWTSWPKWALTNWFALTSAPRPLSSSWPLPSWGWSWLSSSYSA